MVAYCTEALQNRPTMEAELADDKTEVSLKSLAQRTRPIKYEHPLNERYRFFLRLEHLFNIIDHHLGWESPENSHTAIRALLDIISVVGRTDIKTESVKELDRIANRLTALTSSPGIELTRLDDILASVKGCSTELRNIAGPVDKPLKDEDLLKILQQRNSIPGGMCDFDLPAFRYWLNQPAGRRLDDIRKWMRPFRPLRNAIDIALELIRASTSYETQIAEDGIYKQSLDPKFPCQLIIVTLPANSNFYAEFSGSKHRFAVRFLDSTQQHPTQTTESVEFDLSCCRL